MTIAALKTLFYSFKGRIGRKSYWLAMLAILVVMFVLVVLASLAPAPPKESPVAILLFGLAILGLVSWPIFAISIKRLHDRNRPAWWLLPFYFIPTALDKWNDKLPEDTPLWWITLAVGFSLALWGLIDMGFLKGSAGANDYGEPDV